MTSFDPREERAVSPSLSGEGLGPAEDQAVAKESQFDLLAKETLQSREGRLAFDADAQVRVFGEHLRNTLLGGCAGNLATELQSIPGCYHERIAFYLLESYELRGAPELIIQSLHLFEGIDRELVARRLLDTGEEGAASVAKFFTKFDGVDPSTLLTGLMRYPQIDPQFWLQNLERFPLSHHDSIVSHLIDNRHINTVVDLVPRISVNRHREIAEKIMVILELSKQRGETPVAPSPEYFIRHLKRFWSVSAEDALARLVVLDADTAVSVAFALDRFPDIDAVKLADKLRQSVVRNSQDSVLLGSLASLIPSLPKLSRAERIARLLDISPVAAGRARERGDPLFSDMPVEGILPLSVRRQLTELQNRPDSAFWQDLSPEIDIEHLLEILDPQEFERGDFDSFWPEGADKEKAMTAARSFSFKQICHGSLANASAIIKKFDLKPSDLHREMSAELSTLLGETTMAMSAESVRRVLAIGAWSLLEPGVVEHISDDGIRSRFLRYRAIFGDPSLRELDHLRRFELLDRFLVEGVPVLSAHGILRDENLADIGAIIPKLIREAGSAGAWMTHGRHLAARNESALCSLDGPEAVVRELQILLEFYRIFHGACAPVLYADFRARTGGPAVEGMHEREPLLEWRASFESAVLSPSSNCPITWDRRAIEYLDAWTRSRGVVQERAQWVIDYAAEGIDDLRLRPRSIFVMEDNHGGQGRSTFTSEVTQGYRALTQIILSLQKCDVETMRAQEKVRLRVLIHQHLEKVERWLHSERAEKAPSVVCAKRATEVERLKELSERIDEAKGTRELLTLLLKVDHRFASHSIVRIVVGEALSRLREPTEFVQLLEAEPSDRSVRGLGEFLRNQLFDETFEALSLSLSERKRIKKTLPRFDVDSVFHDSVERHVRNVGTKRGVEQIDVYPTRGVLAEFAGSFADACWTDKSDLMRRHPNAMALVFVSPKRHELPHAVESSETMIVTNELVGACYLLKAKDIGGDDVLVIRGLNPRERPFERLSIESFVEGLIDEVVVPYARELGVKKIVVPFDEVGHAQTNRLRVGAYLQVKYGQMLQVPLDPKGPSTHFNERRIFDKCRLVRVLQ